MDESLDAEAIADTLSALASPIRVRILLALTETRQANWDHRGMNYSDLRDAVDVEDGGRFNYHINELRDQFVRGEDGHYWLTPAGSRVVDEMFAQTFSGTPESASAPVGWTCPEDGQQLEATVEDGLIVVSCPDHGVVFDMMVSFGSTADRGVEEIFAWANRRALWYLESVSWNVCPHCAGSFGAATFDTVSGDEHDLPGNLDADSETLVLVGMTCTRCGVSFRIPASSYVFTRPPAIAFFHDHGLDYRSLELEYGDVDWSHESSQTDEGVIVCFDIDGDRLELEVDEHLETRSYRRLPSSDQSSNPDEN